MLGFLIIFGVVSLFVGLPIALGNLGSSRKRFVKGLIKTIAFVGVISGMLYVGIMLSYKSDVKIWNNGQHENCGQWEIFDIEKHSKLDFFRDKKAAGENHLLRVSLY